MTDLDSRAESSHTSPTDQSTIADRFAGALRSLVVPVGAVVAALVVGALMLWALGASPFEGYKALFSDAFGGADQLADTAIKSMPLLLVGVGICIAFRAGVINIGGEGQIVAGAILSTLMALALPGLPRVLLVPLVLIAGALGGAIWGAIPGALKAYANVNEILSTIMMNIVAAQFLSFLLQDLLIEEGAIRIQQTERLSENSHLPILPGGTRLHLGVPIAILVAVLGYFLLFRSALGVRLRAVGHNPHASRYAGMPVKKSIVQALALSGACAGIAGAVLVFGSESHRLIGEGGASGFTQSAGFNGIVAAPVWWTSPTRNHSGFVSLWGPAQGWYWPATSSPGTRGVDRRPQWRRRHLRCEQPQTADQDPRPGGAAAHGKGDFTCGVTSLQPRPSLPCSPRRSDSPRRSYWRRLGRRSVSDLAC